MTRNRGATFLLGAAGSGWLIYDITSRTEAPSAALAAMQYVLLAMLLITTLYSGARWLAAK
jgi:hypothetical protein